jgi:hypothetical protein
MAQVVLESALVDARREGLFAPTHALVLLPITLVDSPVSEDHPPPAMLHPLHPVTVVFGARFQPLDKAPALEHISTETSVILNLSILPGVFAETVFLVFEPGAHVHRLV